MTVNRVRDQRAVWSVTAAVFLFSLISITTVVATRDGASLSMVLFARYLIAAVVLLPVVARQLGHGLGPRHWRLMAVGGAGQALLATLTLSALEYMPAATMVFLFYTFPAWVAVLETARGTERLNGTRLLALGMSLAGVVLLVGLTGLGNVHPTGAALALSAALLYAAYLPTMNHLQRGIDPRVSGFLIFVGVAIIAAVFVVARQEFSLDQSWRAWAAIATVGVLSTGVALIMFMHGLSVLGPLKTSIVSTIEPFFAAMFAALVLAQPVTMPMMLGGGLIALAVLVLQRHPSPTSPVNAVQRTAD